MSEQRLFQLKETLESRDWYITDLNDLDTWKSLLKVSNDGDLRWKISKKNRIIILSFFLTDILGGKTKNLQDIFSVSAISSNTDCLFFSKIKSEEWKNDLLEFVYKLDSPIVNSPHNNK